MYNNIIHTVLYNLSSRQSVTYLERFGLVQNGKRYMSKNTSAALNGHEHNLPMATLLAFVVVTK